MERGAAGGARAAHDRARRTNRNGGAVTTTLSSAAGRHGSAGGATATATTAGLMVSFQSGHGDVRTEGCVAESAIAIPCNITQRWAPLRRQQAGRPPYDCTLASSGCNGSKAVNSSKIDANHRLIAKAYHRHGCDGWCLPATSHNVEMSPLNIAATRSEMRTEQELLLKLRRNNRFQARLGKSGAIRSTRCCWKSGHH